MESKDIMVAISACALTVSLLLVGLVTTPNSIASTIDTGTDRPPILINNGISSGLPCNYNIIQAVGGVTRNIQAINCITGIVDFQSTNASSVFNFVVSQFNKVGGGVVHVTGYNTTHVYNITTAILMPKNGHLYLYGDGPEFTVLEVPSGSDNDIFGFYYQSGLVHDSFFNHISNIQIVGNRLGANAHINSGINFNSTGFGVVDSLFDDLFIESFAQDDVSINLASAWNAQFSHDVIEHAGRYCFNDRAGEDLRITDSKFLFCHGSYALVIAGVMSNFHNLWFFKNDKSAIDFGGGAYGDTLTGSTFNDNGQSGTNTYFDIDLQNSRGDTIVGNTFTGSDTTVKIKCGVSFSVSTAVNQTIVGNSFSNAIGTTWGTSPVCGVSGTNGNIMTNNARYNPVNKVTNFVDGSSFTPFGTTGTIVNGTTYTIWNTPVFVTSSGGTAVLITLQDNNGNTLQSNLVSLAEQYIPIGYKIKFTFAVIPTVGVYFQ